MDQRIILIIETMLKKGGFPIKKVSREDKQTAGQVVFQIETDEPRHMIGMRGDTLRAIDYLVKKMTEKEGIDAQFLVDVDGYRGKQIKDLEQKALMMAERARSFQYDVELTPMSAYERLIVHATLQSAPDVKTESRGEGKERRIVIKYSPTPKEVV